MFSFIIIIYQTTSEGLEIKIWDFFAIPATHVMENHHHPLFVLF